MRSLAGILLAFTLLHCGSERSAKPPASDGGDGDGGNGGGGGSTSARDASAGDGGSSSGGGSNPTTGGARSDGGSGPGAGGEPPRGYPDAFAPDGAPPKIGEAGCGFDTAAFCDTFEGPSHRNGRAGELDSLFWSASRHQGQLSASRAMGIGMAVIPECRPGMPTHVWPDDDSLVCNPTADIASPHLLVAAAAQNYGQNSYRIRQPFDFAGRTGKIVFDAALNMLSPIHGWVALAITEDPMSVPGYTIMGNDEGSVVPRNGVEVHFVNFGDMTRVQVRNVQVFHDYVDTVYPSQFNSAPAWRPGKMNHYEFFVSEQGIRITVTPPSEDGVTFGAPEIDWQVDAPIPFTRGYVHLSVHNHAMIKYTQPDSPYGGIVDAAVAQIDNIGFDGPVIGNWREYEVPDALARFVEPLGDPYNTENVGYDVAYVVGDEAAGPKQVLHFTGVDTANVESARLAFTTWFDFHSGTASNFAYRARLNGKRWLERKFSPAELAFFSEGPTTLDPAGAPIGDPASQGRLALLLDVPLEELVQGDNTLEFVTANIATGYPPLVSNVDLVMQTK